MEEDLHKEGAHEARRGRQGSLVQEAIILRVILHEAQVGGSGPPGRLCVRFLTCTANKALGIRHVQQEHAEIEAISVLGWHSIHT